MARFYDTMHCSCVEGPFGVAVSVVGTGGLNWTIIFAARLTDFARQAAEHATWSTGRKRVFDAGAPGADSGRSGLLLADEALKCL